MIAEIDIIGESAPPLPQDADLHRRFMKMIEALKQICADLDRNRGEA